MRHLLMVNDAVYLQPVRLHPIAVVLLFEVIRVRAGACLSAMPAPGGSILQHGRLVQVPLTLQTVELERCMHLQLSKTNNIFLLKAKMGSVLINNRW